MKKQKKWQPPKRKKLKDAAQTKAGTQAKPAAKKPAVHKNIAEK